LAIFRAFAWLSWWLCYLGYSLSKINFINNKKAPGVGAFFIAGALAGWKQVLLRQGT